MKTWMKIVVGSVLTVIAILIMTMVCNSCELGVVIPTLFGLMIGYIGGVATVIWTIS